MRDIAPERVIALADRRLAQGVAKQEQETAALDLRGRVGAAAQAGRGGDTEIGHLTPGDAQYLDNPI